MALLKKLLKKMIKISKKIQYEARLNKAIIRRQYRFFKKGEVIFKLSEKEFKKLTPKNMHKYTNITIVIGHGVNEYFELENDISFFKVEIIVAKKETPAILFTKKSLSNIQKASKKRIN